MQGHGFCGTGTQPTRLPTTTRGGHLQPRRDGSSSVVSRAGVVRRAREEQHPFQRQRHRDTSFHRHHRHSDNIVTLASCRIRVASTYTAATCFNPAPTIPKATSSTAAPQSSPLSGPRPHYTPPPSTFSLPRSHNPRTPPTFPGQRPPSIQQSYSTSVQTSASSPSIASTSRFEGVTDVTAAFQRFNSTIIHIADTTKIVDTTTYRTHNIAASSPTLPPPPPTAPQEPLLLLPNLSATPLCAWRSRCRLHGARGGGGILMRQQTEHGGTGMEHEHGFHAFDLYHICHHSSVRLIVLTSISSITVMLT